MEFSTKVWMFVGVLLAVILCAGLYMMYLTKHYINTFPDCDPEKPFCNIKVIPLALPDKFIQPLMEMSKVDGKRLDMPEKKQKAISLQRIQVKQPGVVDWYQSLAPVVSAQLGFPVHCTSLSQPNTLSLVVYEREGDYIDWHYDLNTYKGRFFTCLIPVSFEPTCGKYLYKNAQEKVEAIELERGQALVFEGDKVYHRSAKLCAGQRRILLSCTFVTNVEFNPFRLAYHRLKNFGSFWE